MNASKKRNRLVIEFTHPGKEYLPLTKKEDTNVTWDDENKNSGIRKWNELPKHKRKFLSVNGKYMRSLNSKVEWSTVTCWGEWEAQSRFKKTNSLSPKYVHAPFLDKTYQGPRRHNTDPFIFGDSFWYTNCKQEKNPFLRSLDHGSIILFGSESKVGFLLDTVFVVKNGYEPAQISKQLDEFPEQLKVNNLLHNNLVHDASKKDFTFYEGLMNNTSADFFSFVPCKPSKGGLPQEHERPILEPWIKFYLQKPGAGTVCTRLLQSEMIDGSLTMERSKAYWELIANACIEQGFSLGVHFNLPEISFGNSFRGI